MSEAEEKTDDKKTLTRKSTGLDYSHHKKKKKCRCCSCDPEREQPDDILERAMHFEVNTKDRKCTDCYCCIVYLVFLAIWVGVFGIAIYFGNIYSLTYGRDHQNLLCGVDHNRSYAWWSPPEDDWGLTNTHNFIGKKYVYYPRLKDDLFAYALNLGTSLGKMQITDFSYQQLLNITLTGVCVKECPRYGAVICTNNYELKTRQAYRDTYGKHCNENIDGQCVPSNNAVAKCTGKESFGGLIKNLYYYQNQELCANCWVTPINTTEIFFRCLEIIWTKKTKTEKCIWPENKRTVNGVVEDILPGDPAYILAKDDECITKQVFDNDFSEQPAYDNPVAELLGDSLATMQGWITDAWHSYYVILVCGCVLAMIVGFIWILLLRWLTKTIVWLTIVAIILILLIVSAWCWLNTGWIPSHLLAGALQDVFNTLGVPASWNVVTQFLNTTFPSCGNSTGSCGDSVTQTGLNKIGLDLGDEANLKTYYQVFAITFTVLFVVTIAVVIILAKKIMIAIAIIEEAARAIMRMPVLVFLPFGAAVFLLLNFLWLVLLGLLIESLEDLQLSDVLSSVTGFVTDNIGNCSHVSVANITSQDITNLKNYDPALPAAAAACSGLSYLHKFGDLPLNTFLTGFHIFCFLWTNHFIQGIIIMIVAGAVADWYWTRPSGPDPEKAYKGGDGKSFKWPLLRSIHRTFRYHLGSIAFGSFLVAVVQFLRVVLEYIKNQTKGWAERNKCYQIMLKVVTILLWCFEKCIKFITRNAFIMIAMQGHGFCDSCCHAFKLLLTNLIQFVLVSCFSKVVITLGKLAIMASSIMTAYLWLSADSKFQEVVPSDTSTVNDGYAGSAPVTNRAIPLFLVGLLGYGCAAAFLHVYDLAIGTILLCFCEDYKVHKVDDPNEVDLHMEVYMPNSLRKIVLSRKEFKHMQHPMTQEQLMNLAGIDIRSDAEKEKLLYPEVIELCKKILVKSDEFLHLGVAAHDLTDKIIIDNTGGPELDKKLKEHKNPMYDKYFAEAVARGDKKVKKGHADNRLYKYLPDMYQQDVLDIICRAGLIDTHGATMTHEAILAKATKTVGKEEAEQLNETPGRKLVKRMTERKLGRKNKIDVEPVETPVTDVKLDMQKANKKGAFVTENEVI